MRKKPPTRKKRSSKKKSRSYKQTDIVEITTEVRIAVAGGFQKMEHGRSVKIVTTADRIPEAGERGLQEALELYKEGAAKVFRVAVNEVKSKASKLRETADDAGLL